MECPFREKCFNQRDALQAGLKEWLVGMMRQWRRCGRERESYSLELLGRPQERCAVARHYN